MSFSVKDFKKAMGSFATGVTIITTSHNDHPLFGVTVNSFTSLSLEPPMVLFCLGKGSYAQQIFNDVTHCVINILEGSQQQLSQIFAATHHPNWDDIAYHTDDNHTPILDDSLATASCTISQKVEGGDHWIYLCNVTQVATRKRATQPLVYFQSGYRNLQTDNEEQK